MKQILIYFLIVTFLTFSMLTFWGCDKEEIIDISGETEIETVVNDLAYADTEIEAQKAICNLLNKAEIGTYHVGSKYEPYAMTDESIAQLAEAQMLYKKGELTYSMGEIFEDVMAISNKVNMAEVDFDAAANKLGTQTESALANPDDSKNAMLAVIAAEGDMIPTSAPLYRETTIKSPVQNILFGIWLHRELAGSKKSFDNNTMTAPAIEPVVVDYDEVACYTAFLVRIAHCRRLGFFLRLWCYRNAGDKLEECLANIHDQGDSQ
ncbi:hypothetical protein GF312_04835 [Candidatus Poribacteria bacterium]|nr:hypothetical protein [Candidatus Poribacteria bacterium]